MFYISGTWCIVAPMKEGTLVCWLPGNWMKSLILWILMWIIHCSRAWPLTMPPTWRLHAETLWPSIGISRALIIHWTWWWMQESMQWMKSKLQLKNSENWSPHVTSQICIVKGSRELAQISIHLPVQLSQVDNKLLFIVIDLQPNLSTTICIQQNNFIVCRYQTIILSFLTIFNDNFIVCRLFSRFCRYKTIILSFLSI